MKRASFTLFQPQRWMSLGQSALMVLFTLCIGMQSANAQELVEMPTDLSSVVETIDECNGEVTSTSPFRFTDDGAVDGNYSDANTTSAGGARADTVTFCPENAWSRVKIEFTDFDVAPGDFLDVYDGHRDSLRTGGPITFLGSASGSGGPSQFVLMGGGATPETHGAGWAQASCSPITNPSGCLTFVFRTDNLNSKGAGWDAWVDCVDRAAELDVTPLANLNLACPAFGVGGGIPFPTVSACGANITPGTPESLVEIAVTNQSGDACLAPVIGSSADAPLFIGFDPGIYTVTYTLVSDRTKTESDQFSVQLPNMVCNDELNIPLGSACALQITPDDLLEDQCNDMDLAFTAYDITIFLGSGKDAVELGTNIAFTGATNNFGDLINSSLYTVTYPTITAADVAAAGMLPCNATARVVIERVNYIYRELADDGVLFTNDCVGNSTLRSSCESIINFSDQSAPFIALSAGIDTLIACGPDAIAGIVLQSASAVDNCADDIEVQVASVTLDDIVPCFGDDNETLATVVLSATDDCGNTSTRQVSVTLIRPNFPDHFVQVGDIDPRDCNDEDNSSEVPGMAVGTVNNGVFTPTDTVDLSVDEYICGYRLLKNDIEIPGTDCGKKVFRYWSLLDWCDNSTGPSVVDTTFIEFTDTEAPVFVGEESDQVIAPVDIALGPFDCTYDITQHGAPSATDNCGLDEVILHRVFRIEDGTNWEVPASGWATLDCDSFRLMYIATDECHEQLLQDTTRQIVVIQDVTAPSAICTDELHVSVPNDAGARIHYSDIDAGSFDACGIASIEIRKEGGTYGPTVDITCEDVHNSPVIEMRVTDNKGNTNTCWMTVTAEDKIAPICGDLDDLEFVCNDFHTGELGADTDGEFVELTGDLLALYNSTFGDPFADGNCLDNLSCGPLTKKQYYRLTELNCGELDIDRRFTVTDWSDRESNAGTQHIDVDYEAEWTLTFPVDVDLTCGDAFPAAATAENIIGNGSCDLWALEVSEKTFEVPGDICMKVERTYELINWCVYEAGTDAISVPRDDADTSIVVSSAGNETVGRYTYVQVLRLYVNEAPSISIADVETCIVGEGDLEPFGMADNTPGFAPFECDEERTFSATGANCAGVDLASENFTWIFTAGDGTPEEGTGSSFTRVVSPKTNYRVEFWVSDGCGNSSGAVQEYEFWDCKKPTPYVLHGLAIEIMQTGSIQLWANDLNQGSYDNCTVQNQLRYRLYAGDPVDGPQDIDAILALDENITFECPIFGLQSVSFYVIDEENNWDVVGTYVSVQTNNGACTDGQVGLVGGKITNALGENVELVNVSVNGGDNTMATGATGEFQFDLALEGDYTITPEKNIQPLNGVSTYDLVLISKHILGLEAFDSPYKYIAADVNKSGTITAFDMVQLRQLILNITSEFSNNTSWRFVDAKHEFTSENPAGENFDEFMNINNLAGDMMSVDFIATKIGDVNGNAAANSLLGAESRTTNGTLNLNVTDRFVEAGQTVTVDFTSADIAATQGYQFTMDFAGLDLVELNEGVAKANNFNTSLAKRGVLTTSWNGEATDENLFSLTFTATTNGLLSELVSVNSDVTAAEAYNTAGELLDVAINFNSNNVSAAFDLSQNTPNPFNGETLIGFNLPQAGIATLKVMDVQGKVLTVISQEGVKGYNQVTLNAKTLGATGVLYYQLESSDNIATKKMIIID